MQKITTCGFIFGNQNKDTYMCQNSHDFIYSSALFSFSSRYRFYSFSFPTQRLSLFVPSRSLVCLCVRLPFKRVCALCILSFLFTIFVLLRCVTRLSCFFSSPTVHGCDVQTRKFSCLSKEVLQFGFVKRVEAFCFPLQFR